MKITSSAELVSKALKEIKTITTDEAHTRMTEGKSNIIDIRDIRELQKEGRIENSKHMPRGMLEFWLDPKSPYSKDIDNSKEIVLFCAAGGRSALAAKTLKEMGFNKVSHVEGGFGNMSNSGFKVIK